MLSLLSRMKVGMRLAVAFTILILLSLAMVATGLLTASTADREIDLLANTHIEKIRIADEMLESNGHLSLALRDFLMTEDATARAEAQARIAEERKHFTDLRDELEAFAASDAARKVRNEMDAARGTVRPLNDRVLALATADREAAQDLLMSEAAPAMKLLNDAIRANAAMVRANAAEAYAYADAAIARGRTLLFIGGALVVVVSGLLAFAITRSLTRPLGRATEVARAIADGRFDSDVQSDAQDETGELLRSMAQMQGQLRRFSEELKTLVRLHYAENPRHRMPEDFPGDYGTLAAGVNGAIFEHVDAMMDAISVMDEYGRGELTRDARRLPGERAVLHESIDRIKANLQATSGEIRRLADAAARGDFSVRGDESRFEAEFRAMIVSLNGLMQEADSGLHDVGTVVRAIAEGDLTQRLDKQYQGAFGRLASDVNQTVDRLTAIVGDIQASVMSIDTASGEIASGNSDLSARTEQQAASLEETASSMEEMTSTVKQNAENAHQANQLAQSAGTVAESGGAVVREVVTTMSAISDSSKRIADIIGVIDSIAFQTNILALNAAVEAARAGEQGRGFAVVASEVRTLAQRSASAATEIKALISDSVGKVDAGSALVDRAGSTMQEIVVSVRRVTEIMREISDASSEQSSGIEQVGLTVTQLDESTQQNAALVEQASAASRSLSEQAGELRRAVAAFKLRDSARRAGAAPVLPAAVKPQPAKPVAAPARSASAKPAAAKPARRTEGAAAPAMASGGEQWSEF